MGVYTRYVYRAQDREKMGIKAWDQNLNSLHSLIRYNEMCLYILCKFLWVVDPDQIRVVILQPY